MPKKPVKKRKPTAKSRQPKPKPKAGPKPYEIPNPRFQSAGVQVTAIRGIVDQLTKTFEKGGTEAQSILEALTELKAWAEVAEERVVLLGRKHYPMMKWPETVAYWREDLNLPRISHQI